MKRLKYYIFILISVLAYIMPGAGVLYYVYKKDILVSALLASPILLIPLFNYLRLNARYNAEADNFGMTNNFDYKKLSGKEKREFDKARQMEMDRLIPQSKIIKMTSKCSKDPKSELSSLIGLTPAKNKIKEVIARTIYEKEKNKKYMYKGHFAFVGNPGTGKTTVARILAGYLYDLKVIKKNIVIECNGNDFRGMANGDSGKIAEILVYKALQGVLFIDEAYALNSEAINTLIKLMEEQEIVIIFAGYTKQINEMLDKNPGFRSRIKDIIPFNDYSVMEAVDIFRSMAASHDLVVTAEAQNEFMEIYTTEQSKKDFGNGRTVRNILDKAITKHAVNIMDNKIKDEDKFKLVGIDLI